MNHHQRAHFTITHENKAHSRDKYCVTTQRGPILRSSAHIRTITEAKSAYTVQAYNTAGVEKKVIRPALADWTRAEKAVFSEGRARSEESRIGSQTSRNTSENIAQSPRALTECRALFVSNLCKLKKRLAQQDAPRGEVVERKRKSADARGTRKSHQRGARSLCHARRHYLGCVYGPFREIRYFFRQSRVQPPARALCAFMQIRARASQSTSYTSAHLSRDGRITIFRRWNLSLMRARGIRFIIIYFFPRCSRAPHIWLQYREYFSLRAVC